jgi:hypothetical protein
VVFLEQNVNAPLGQRYGRWWTAYGQGGSVYLPLVMANSGHQISTGSVNFASVYAGMIDSELQGPAGADVWAVATRLGDHFRVSVHVRNRSGSTWTTAMDPTIHVLVYEDAAVGVTNTYVRSAAYSRITSALDDGATTGVVLETAAISPADWAKVHVIALVDYRPGGTTGAYDMLQAAHAWVRHRPGDFDGDGTTDAAVYRPSSGTWFWLKSATANAQFGYKGWGVQALGDVPAPADFDGDGVIDPAVFRPSTGTWFVLQSGGNYANWTYFGWGTTGDVPVPGDYDGDGLADGAVFRPSTGEWFVRPSSSPSTQQSVVFGQAGDVPLPGDYDGDRITDAAVYRPASGTWFVLTSSSSFTQWWYRGWGEQAQGDVPVPGDYDGDGKTDLAVFRAQTGTWFVLTSSSNTPGWLYFGWGATGDVPVPGDFDGDGTTDGAVYRPSTGTWYVRPARGTTPWSVTFGAGGDLPLGGR